MKYIKSIFLLSAIIFVSCNKDNKSSPIVSSPEIESDMVYVTKAQFEGANMRIGKLEEKDFAKTIHTSGVIDVPPQNRAVISAFSGGYIKNTPLLIGDKVKKGERLVTLENPEFIIMQQNYMETAEQLSYLKSEYERQKTMFEENITSRKSFLKAESEYKTAVARTNSLKKSLEMMNISPSSVLQGSIVSQANIYSPIDGYVTQIYINTGSYVSPSDKIMEIINTDHIHLELKVFEKDLLQIKKGQEILFTVPEASKKVYYGEVHLVGTTIDPKARISMLHGHIDENDETNFTTGMFIEADIVTSTIKHMALPEDAVVELEGKKYVLLVESDNNDGYKLHPIEVQIESTYKGFTNFKTTLDADARFLTKGGFVLLQSADAGAH